MLQCPNYNCQASNAESSHFCHQCQTPLPKRYLWAVGLEPNRLEAGAQLAERYQYQGTQIFLDLQPATPPAMPPAMPLEARPYLRLTDYRLHLPQVYGWVESPSSKDATLLLSDAAIYRPSVYTNDYPPSGKSTDNEASSKARVASRRDAFPQSSSPIPLPQLQAVWGSASPWQRLNWLWQIAQLWEPLQREQVASSLLSGPLLRAEGSVVRLLELKRDSPAFDGADSNAADSPAMPQLGRLFQSWITSNEPDSNFLKSLCRHLIEGKIEQPSQLVDVLEGAIAQLSPARSQTIHLVTQTDQGPSRSRNEDACFPPSGTLSSYASTSNDSPSSSTTILSTGNTGSGNRVEDSKDESGSGTADQPVLIVCDGIGGHQGGDVASQLAIHSVCDHLIEQTDAHAPLETFQHLSDAVYDANDLISQRNDGEQRRNRQRMGTTLVMALVDGYQCYLSHIGDSRAYWITHWGCHQITLDDDVASREVRLGHTIYPYALNQPSAGSLVQALGMADSASLHPTVQRLLLSGSGLLLLCSDGLSDNDLVELFWQSTLLPVLTGEKAIADASQELVTLANTQNGYDNVTVGLLLWQVTPPDPSTAKALTVSIPPARSQALSTRLQLNQTLTTRPAASRDFDWPDSPPGAGASPGSTAGAQSKPVAPIALNTDLRRPAGLGALLAGIVILLGLGGFLVYALVPSVGSRFRRTSSSPPPIEAGSPQPPADAVRSTEGVTDRAVLRVGDLLRLGGGSPNTASLPAYADPSSLAEPDGTAPEAAEIPEVAETADPAETAAPAADPAPVGYLTAGTLVQVLGRSEFSQSTRWVELQVCALPERGAVASNGSAAPSPAPGPDAVSPSPDAEMLLQPGETAWLLEATLTSFGFQPVANETSGVCPPQAN